MGGLADENCFERGRGLFRRDGLAWCYGGVVSECFRRGRCYGDRFVLDVGVVEVQFLSQPDSLFP